MSLFHSLFELFGAPEWSLIEAHQASTHLSLGLLLGAAGFDLAALVNRRHREIWRQAAFWMQLAGLVFLAVTFGLGFYGNPLPGKSGEPAQKIEWHKNFGYAALGVFALLSVWRVARFSRWKSTESGAFVLVNALGIAIITLTGWMGGHIFD